MNHPRPSADAMPSAERRLPRAAPLPRPLSRRGQRIARTAWLVLTALALLVFVLVVPSHVLWLTTLSRPFVADPDAVRAGLARFGLTASVYAAYQTGLAAVYTLCSCLLAAALIRRNSAEPMALYVAFLLVLLGIALPFTLDALLPFFAPADILLKAFSVGAWLLFYVFFCIFPDGRFVPGWTRWLPLLWLVREGARFFLSDRSLSPAQWPPALQVADAVCSAVVCLGAQAYRYRRVSSPAQRQQTKWVLFGLTLALVALFVFAAPTVWLPGRLRVGPLFDLGGIGILVVGFLCIPITLTVAMLRAQLWEIDVVVNRTLVYSLLVGTLAAAYAGSVLLLLFLFQGLTGVRNGLALSGATLAMAMLFQPLRAGIQRGIDRRFYRDKYVAAQALADFSRRVRDEVDLEAVTGDLVAVVDATLHPTQVSLWLRPREQAPQPEVWARPTRPS